MPVAQLDRQRERCQGRDPAQAAEPRDDVMVGGRGRELADCLVEPIAARLRLQDVAVTLVEAHRERPLEALAAQPTIVLARPRPALPEQAAPQKQLRKAMPRAIRSPRASSRARTRSRAASSLSSGTRTAVSSPSRNSRASR